MIDAGALIQDDAAAIAAEATLRTPTFELPMVATNGRALTLLNGGGDAGVNPDRNAIGVVAGRLDGGSAACFALIVREPAAPLVAKVALARETSFSEVTVANTIISGGALREGERFAATLDRFTTPSAPLAIGALPDSVAGGVVATAMTTCAEPGRVGLRTRYARASFNFLIVFDLERPGGCGPRGP